MFRHTTLHCPYAWQSQTYDITLAACITIHYYAISSSYTYTHDTHGQGQTYDITLSCAEYLHTAMPDIRHYIAACITQMIKHTHTRQCQTYDITLLHTRGRARHTTLLCCVYNIYIICGFCLIRWTVRRYGKYKIFNVTRTSHDPTRWHLINDNTCQHTISTRHTAYMLQVLNNRYMHTYTRDQTYDIILCVVHEDAAVPDIRHYTAPRILSAMPAWLDNSVSCGKYKIFNVTHTFHNPEEMAQH